MGRNEIEALRKLLESADKYEGTYGGGQKHYSTPSGAVVKVRSSRNRKGVAIGDADIGDEIVDYAEDETDDISVLDAAHEMVEEGYFSADDFITVQTAMSKARLALIRRRDPELFTDCVNSKMPNTEIVKTGVNNGVIHNLKGKRKRKRKAA